MTDPKGSNPASTPRPAPQPAPPKAPQPQPPQTTASSIKETIESILVAFILAFIFRSFVVEAFIIPTGSMAPTLLGAHMRFQCPDCGYGFTTNYHSGDGNTAPPRRAYGRYTIYCPNCGYRLPDSNPSEPMASATNPPVHYGDRILVLKYQYILQSPQRWDVVVFKSPDDSTNDAYNMNYIKRLIGKPGETVMILDGDIYVRREGESAFQVQTKPYAAQEALWRIIYDNDYHPQGKPRGRGKTWRQPWEQAAGSGWQVGGRTFDFANNSGSGILEFDPQANPEKHAMRDWLAYDVTEHLDPQMAWRPRYVGDLRLAVTYRRSSGTGPLDLKLAKLGDTFTARLLPDQAQLLHQRDDGAEPILLGSVPLEATAKDPLRIELANADYRVTVRINGKDVLQTTPQQYAPDLDARLLDDRQRADSLPPTVRIVAERQACELSHVSLWRDVYYQDPRGGPQWGTPANPITLGSDEFFVLGDNSFISQDGRYWRQPIRLPGENLDAEAGRVPGRFLLGKAFFVYWPAGFRPFSDNGIGIIPNFGDMRFIH